MRKGLVFRPERRDRKESGQAVLEYILMVAVAIVVIGTLGVGIRRSVVMLWEKMARDIAAPCPKCPAPDTVRIR